MFEYEKDAIILKIKESIQAHEKSMSHGLLKSFEDYKLIVGKIKGLEESIHCIERVYDKLIKGDNYDSRTLK